VTSTPPSSTAPAVGSSKPAIIRSTVVLPLPLATRRVPSLPPEPLKRLGGGLVRAAIIACEEAEEAGRRPGLAARAGAAIPRALRMQIGTR
jgi:hypothetical protein